MKREVSMNLSNTYAVIMAGGVGSRFWPSSREKTPKQFLDLTGCGMPMIASTVERLSTKISKERILVVTAQVTAEAAQSALPMLPKENILAEPMGRNTAACIGWAALHVRRRNPMGIMAVMPSDHLVTDVEEFRVRFQIAVDAAAQGRVTLFGVKPTGPETGFGYVELGDSVNADVFEALRFVEKPDLKTAQGYVASGRFLWNSGMFFFPANRILEEIEKHLPETASLLTRIDQSIGANEEEMVNAVYPQMPSISIDFGVMERLTDCLCVPVDFGWHDVGSWSAAYELASRDDNDNFATGDTVAVSADGCYVRTSDKKKLVALVNVKNLIVVDTGDALLICDRDSAQSVKDVVSSLKSRGRTDLL
jgi:mannose-1-phosphate guanylyltransferase